VRLFRALLSCGAIGAGYGAVVGAGYAAALYPWLTLVGALLGLVGGFVAGVLGGMFDNELAWIVGGLVGGASPGFLLFWPDTELWALWIGGGIAGAVVGWVVSGQLVREDSRFTMIRWLRAHLGTLRVEGENAWMRYICGHLLCAAVLTLLVQVSRAIRG